MNPSPGSVYELQFRVIHEAIGDKKQNKQVVEVTAKDHMGKELVPKTTGGMKPLPMACALGTGQPLQIQLNVPLKNPFHVLHDIVTHNVTPLGMQNVMVDQMQLEEEGDDESSACNFKAIAKKVDLSPRAQARSGKKGKKQQKKQALQPIRILPKSAVSQTK